MTYSMLNLTKYQQYIYLNKQNKSMHGKYVQKYKYSALINNNEKDLRKKKIIENILRVHNVIVKQVHKGSLDFELAF